MQKKALVFIGKRGKTTMLNGIGDALGHRTGYHILQPELTPDGAFNVQPGAKYITIDGVTTQAEVDAITDGVATGFTVRGSYKRLKISVFMATQNKKLKFHKNLFTVIDLDKL